MARRLLFLLGLVAAAYGGYIVHHEQVINNLCNAELANPSDNFTVSSQCLNIVFPYSEGFVLMLVGAVLTFAALVWSRRVMAGERKYLKDVRAGKYDRENDHLNAHHFNLQKPNAAASRRPTSFEPPREE